MTKSYCIALLKIQIYPKLEAKYINLQSILQEFFFHYYLDNLSALIKSAIASIPIMIIIWEPSSKVGVAYYHIIITDCEPETNRSGLNIELIEKMLSSKPMCNV